MAAGNVAQLADRLWQAEINHSPISPITDTDPGLAIDDAYAIQTFNIERRVAAGRVLRGRKVGLTSRPMQELLGVSEPDFGVLLDDMFVEDGDEIPLETLLQPRIEAEMAFVIGRDLAGPGVTTSNALTAIAGVLPALELSENEKLVYDALNQDESSTDEVIRKTGLPSSAVSVALFSLEMKRAVKQLPGKYFVKLS